MMLLKVVKGKKFIETAKLQGREGKERTFKERKTLETVLPALKTSKST